METKEQTNGDNSLLIAAAALRLNDPLAYERNIVSVAATCGVRLSALQRETSAIINAVDWTTL